MKLKLLFVFTGLAVISLANPIYATDYKVYSGSGCRPAFGQDAGSFEAHGGYIKNVSSQVRTVSCPIVREHLPAAAELDPGMRVASSNGAVAMCTFYSYDQDGGQLDSVYRTTTSSKPTPLIFSGRTIRTLGSGSYAFQCSLPPNGMILNYSLGEPPGYGSN